MKNLSPLTEAQLKQMNFLPFNNANTPIVGALLLCYHKVFGLTVGYYIGQNQFLFPYMKGEGYNWASHWQYHN